VRPLRCPAVDSEWAADQLAYFIDRIDQLFDLEEDVPGFGFSTEEQRRQRQIDDELLMREPIMRQLMNAAEPGLGDYDSHRYDPGRSWRLRWHVAKMAALQAVGLHRFGAEAKARMRPDAPDLVADRLHEWV
jgi:hypothetical protein